MERFFRATPWALPGTLVIAIVMTAAAGPLARKLHAHPFLVWLFGVAVGGYIAVTTTPTADASLLWGQHGDPAFHLAIPRPSDFVGIDEHFLNLSVAAPMGFAAALLASNVRNWWPVVAVLAAPLVAEAIQGYLPIGRSGFSSTDLCFNVTGAVIGLAVGTAAQALAAWRRKRGAGTPRQQSAEQAGRIRQPR
jgi:glycopeptide antibiotics resistance protein